MTLEQIRAMSDHDLNDAICHLRDGFDNYVTDLNAAMSLVPQGLDYNVDFVEALDKVMCVPIDDAVLAHWAMFYPNKPRALCEAFLLWKGGAT